MAEIKIFNMDLEVQVLYFELAGNKIETSKEVPDEGVNTLVTSMKYIEQHKQIGEVCELYKKLIAKDAGDIRRMEHGIFELDKALSKMFNKK